MRRSLLVGVAYILLLEGVAANIDFVFRRSTIMYYVRALSVRWLEQRGFEWAINAQTAPSATTCVLSLIVAGVVPALLGAWLFSVREFRVKTPDGS
jgi:hypothetical protein